ncbi:MAG TPA: OpgC domain-containing protein [Hyphomicrobium sp.]|uniref:OpgC family protein n=1 Tax=Hyphomicrobium sp. TaxID=82 RepID=UPI002CEB5A84|nr:OpgC domain-containing protein [Hyphomicrobium sp.]HRN89551.1 OpgC domain-containing protein [Hyphomicrobium sp.]
MRPSHPKERDLRIDFFRGLVLIFIFIDHIPNNSWAKGTLKNFGFADASEVFVLLAGFSAGLAYLSLEERGGFRAVAERATRRAREIYVWHIGVFLIASLLLFLAARAFGKPSYVNNIVVGHLATDPVTTLLSALGLYYQPNMMNILPMYVLLMLWLPAIIMLLRRSIPLALTVAFSIWLVTNVTGLNLPSFQMSTGWFFNPFAWQLLFTVGAAGAMVARRAPTSAPRPEILIPAGAFVIFAFLVAAPWVAISWLPSERLLPRDLMGAMSKSDLSLWRLLHVLALAYVVAAIVPKNATWLKQSWANAVSLCGKHSLEIFSLGTLLSFLGWIALAELGSSQLMVAAINVAGIAIMSMTAWQLSRRKEDRRALAQAAPVQALAS